MLLRPQGAWEVFRTIGGSVSVAMCNDGVGLCRAARAMEVGSPDHPIIILVTKVLSC